MTPEKRRVKQKTKVQEQGRNKKKLEDAFIKPTQSTASNDLMSKNDEIKKDTIMIQLESNNGRNATCGKCFKDISHMSNSIKMESLIQPDI